MELQIFKNEQFGQVQLVEINNEPWFVGKEIAEILGYQNPSKALKDHVDEEDKLNNETLSSLGQRGGWIINESGLYSLILKSKLPQAKQFKRWVTSEVLPSIRKHGAYALSLETVNEDALIYVLETQKSMRQRQDVFEADLNYLKAEQPINPDVRLDLEKTRKKRVVACMGGMDSPAYMDKSLAKRVFQQAMNDFKEHFRVSRYDLLPKKAIEAAYAYWKNWEPSTNLKMEIHACNNQMSFDFME
ncbi:TPA: ORF6C domain-containing protein [Streptococcus suis]|uniref:ORF6C domain-containing protein n=1 Tax=Streptococcus suis TaxID=1307 RepID=UPI00209B4D94|nr:ORF6C domain-containing protein [Streptococcus suis]MCO8199347.1 ORF6C domain-containing protein [Streptococcus suis]MCO8217096.1 ORF6C domain-containing protein [Streptococcus suis]HEM3468850.1 ORF6C domain-containing protein [Streptococcus suis]HEM3479599.1 ORF6C domain-containing protein [Streptococcus suis]